MHAIVWESQVEYYICNSEEEVKTYLKHLREDAKVFVLRPFEEYRYGKLHRQCIGHIPGDE